MKKLYYVDMGLRCYAICYTYKKQSDNSIRLSVNDRQKGHYIISGEDSIYNIKQPNMLFRHCGYTYNELNRKAKILKINKLITNE